jgi:hypothetical protein
LGGGFALLTMNLNDLLTLYCEQQEARGFRVVEDFARNNNGEYLTIEVTVTVYFDRPFDEHRGPESQTFESIFEAQKRFHILINLNKAIA